MISKIKPGSVILLPKENTQGVYTFLLDLINKQFGDNAIAKVVAKLLLDQFSSILGHRYMHAELYLNNGFQMGAWFNGVHVWKPSLSYYSIAHIYEPKVPVDVAKLVEVAKKYKEAKYDFTSLVLNAVITVLSLGNEINEQAFEEQFKKLYVNENDLICSELISRIYQDLGYKIERESEYVTPDDISNSQLFTRIF